MDKPVNYTIILAIIGILLFVSGMFCWSFIDKKVDKIKSESYNQGYLTAQNDLIVQMNQNQVFPIIYGEGNQTQVQFTNLNEICGGING